MIGMTEEEKLDHMLQYLSENPGADDLRDYSERELGVNADEYEMLIDRLFREGMVEQRGANEGSLGATCEGKFLLIGGGYVVLAYSEDYHKKNRLQALKAKLGLKGNSEKTLLWVTGAAVFSFLALLGVLLQS
jgi:hypothetical protein